MGRRVHTKISQKSEYDDVNKHTLHTHVHTRNIHVYPGDPELIMKGVNVWVSLTSRLVKADLKLTISEESGDVQGETVDSWEERIPEIVQGYQKEVIWNLDETGVFWQALPDHGFGQKGRQCKGGKKSKQKVTVAFTVTAAGTKTTPVVIWSSENPCCYQGVDKSLLPVNYFSQKKAWMTGDILDLILSKINCRLF